MSKEFEALQKLAEHDRVKEKTRQREAYRYARSLGFPYAMARRLQGYKKEKILELSKELKSS